VPPIETLQKYFVYLVTTNKKEPTIEESVLHSEKILGPLPEGWEMAQTDKGDYYFIEYVLFFALLTVTFDSCYFVIN